MKKNLHMYFIALMLSVTFSINVMAQETKSVNKEMYGFFLRNLNLNGEYGFAKINTSDLQEAELICKYSDMKGIFAGACVNNIYYACEYKYETWGPQASDFVSIDMGTGKKEVIGKWDSSGYCMIKYQDMTYDYKNNIMYAVGFDAGTSILFSIDLKTGKAEQVCELEESGVGTLAANKEGELYSMQHDGFLYKINKTDGSMEAILDTEHCVMLSPQSMEFDHTTGLLYWASSTMSVDETESFMLEIDLEKETVTDLGKIGSNSALLALHIPFADSELAPAAPQDVNISADANGALNSVISWINPTTTFDGGELNSLNTVVIKRNDEVIATFDSVEKGQKMTYTDSNIPTDGYYRYIIYATNNEGKGRISSTSSYIGIDIPCRPNNVRMVTNEDCTVGEVTWETNLEGYHGGYIDPNGISYKIVRYPDSVTVADNFKGNSFKDNTIKELRQYCYKVFSCNKMGEAGSYTDIACVMGPAHEIPYTEDFSDIYKTVDNYTFSDGNYDRCSWYFTTPAGYYMFGENLNCAEYIVNPGFEHSGMDADEWIITPPFNFDGNKYYMISFEARSIKDETLEYTIGNNNMFTTHKKIEEFVITANDEADIAKITKYEFDVPSNTNGVRCLGLHLTTEFPSDNYSYLQITNITVKEIEAPLSISAVQKKDGNVRIENNVVYTNDMNGKIAVYDITGKKMSEQTGNKYDMNGMPSGMYIIKTNTTDGSAVIKHIIK